VGSPDGADLQEVVVSVDEVESAPLVDAERAENHVGSGATGAEDGFGLGKELIHVDEAGGSLLGYFVSREVRRVGWR
jgi:hypothetical protein